MNIYNEIHTLAFADFELHRPSAVSHFPHSVECGSRWHTYGSSSGWSASVTISAMGEQFERKHFYLDVPVHDRNKLGEGLTPDELEAFANAFLQTAMTGQKNDLHSHTFDRTHVYRITDLTRCAVPTALISISPCRNSIDNEFYPIRDTCGCSVHMTVDRAVLGALKEAIERQFLLRFWLTKACTGKVKHRDACSALSNRPSFLLFKELERTGDLCILNLTDEHFPGCCILLCYGNRCGKNQHVRYCAGLAYSDDMSSALEKSVIELWQTFRFMHSFYLRGKALSDIEDPYLKHFLESNFYETYIDITTGIINYSKRSKPAKPLPLTSAALIKLLRELQLDGYLYLSSMNSTKRNLHYCKYISPKLFLHMNNASHLNIKNSYSNQFQKQIIPQQLSKMVPFP
ncbi:YcaO-like family protein [Pseudomonas sp. UBA4617]|uniref:YcaO-like family protein n=1 Tax=Pseudomonas sp. UBA4617 TaxID=1947318 RepID=UPI0025FC35C3|nr:YcaO-like family protein [Pseudomonas sp. UBA4617]